jgi:hypothetical protein
MALLPIPKLLNEQWPNFLYEKGLVASMTNGGLGELGEMVNEQNL